MRGSTRIGLLAVSIVCLFALTATSALARTAFYQEKPTTKLLPDAASNNGIAGYGYPIEFVNSSELKLEATGFSNPCAEGEIDTYLNHNTAVAGKAVEASLVAGQFECANPTFLATPSTATAVFEETGNKFTVKGLKFLVSVGAANCVFETPETGVKGTWTNAVATAEEGLGSTIALSGVELESKSGGICPKIGKLTATFGAETFTQTDPENTAFDSERVVYE
ncbi:MAG TPA: hypothetical protein VNY31_07505 [Solirubrobacteraceae bacterium]|jgi:hypothetical protein|nr:hypothetical protein [Solirubrobacteraceae bacterium]